jgi:hypothetical protein
VQRRGFEDAAVGDDQRETLPALEHFQQISPLPTRAGRQRQAFQAGGAQPLPPLAHRGPGNSQLARYGLVGKTLRAA